MPKTCKSCRRDRNIATSVISLRRYRGAGLLNLADLACPDCGVIVPYVGDGSKPMRPCIHESCQAEFVKARNASKGGRRRARCADSDVTAEFVMELRRETSTCVLCDATLVNRSGRARSKEVDHIVPLAAGGKHVRANLRVICARCNRSRPWDGSDISEVPDGAMDGVLGPPRPKGLAAARDRERAARAVARRELQSERGKKAANMRSEGHTWQAISDALGFSGTGAAYNAAKSYAA